MGRALAGFEGEGPGGEIHRAVIGIEPAVGPGAGRAEEVGGILRQIAGMEGGCLARCLEKAADHGEVAAAMGDDVFGGGAQGSDGHGAGFGACVIRATLRVGHERFHDACQPGVLGVVEVIGLGGGEEDLFDTLAEEELGQEGVPAGAEGGEDIAHGLAEVFDRLGSGMDRAQRIDENDLAVDPGEVIAEEGFDDFALVGLEPPFELAPEAAAGDAGGVPAGGRR